MWNWKIMHEGRNGPDYLVCAGTVPYATEELARAASYRERMEHGWTMGHGYYDVVERLES